MMGTRVWRTWIVMPLAFVMIWAKLMCAASAADPKMVSLCPKESVVDSILRFRDRSCVDYGVAQSIHFGGVTEGDEVSLLKSLNMIQKHNHEYVAVLFYASWCPFSTSFRPGFFILSSLYPSISHLAIEESSIRPSILSKYGVHGFPALFLINSTMRVRYHGPRTLESLSTYYSNVTGIKTASLDKGSLDKNGLPSNREKHDTIEQESCPFSWARSPENLFREETYLALATAFVLLRLLHSIFPTLLVCLRFAWRRHIQNARMGSFLEHPRAYLNRVIQLFNSIKEPYKRSNLQEGAMNARAWASKSLATVSIGDASTSRSAPGSECR